MYFCISDFNKIVLKSIVVGNLGIFTKKKKKKLI